MKKRLLALGCTLALFYSVFANAAVYNLDTSEVGRTCLPPNTGIGLTFSCTVGKPSNRITLGTFTDTHTAGSTITSIDLDSFGACNGNYEFELNGVVIAAETISTQSCSCQPHLGTQLTTSSIPVSAAIQAAFVAGGSNTLTVRDVDGTASGCFYGADLTINAAPAPTTTDSIPVFGPVGVFASLVGLVILAGRSLRARKS